MLERVPTIALQEVRSSDNVYVYFCKREVLDEGPMVRLQPHPLHMKTFVLKATTDGSLLTVQVKLGEASTIVYFQR